MAWIVAPNMARLRDQIKARWPGVVVGTIGDLAHSQGVSGHNPDDMAGVRAELSDGDNTQEVRALDPMIGPHFTAADAAELVRILTTNPACRARLYYVIYNRRIYRRRNGWRSEAYTGSDPHTNHPHLSGWADDDANGADWPIEGDEMSAEDVTAIRSDLQRLGQFLTTGIQNQLIGPSQGAWVAEAATGNVLKSAIGAVGSAPAVDVDALADAIVSRLPATVLTAADVKAALGDVLLNGAASTQS